jgi:hypothetical protein
MHYEIDVKFTFRAIIEADNADEAVSEALGKEALITFNGASKYTAPDDAYFNGQYDGLYLDHPLSVEEDYEAQQNAKNNAKVANAHALAAQAMGEKLSRWKVVKE